MYLSENEWCDDDTDDDAAAAAAADDDMTDNMIPMCLTCYAGDTKNGKDKRYRSLFHRVNKISADMRGGSIFLILFFLFIVPAFVLK